MAEDKIYTVKDFARYHSGAMSAAEMHALEKAALSDPFLSDALEGYGYTETPGQDIAELSGKIRGEKNRTKVFFLSPRANNGWLRIAAILVIFAGSAYLFYRFNRQDQQTGLAVNTVKPSLPDTINTAKLSPSDSTQLKSKTIAISEPGKKIIHSKISVAGRATYNSTATATTATGAAVLQTDSSFTVLSKPSTNSTAPIRTDDHDLAARENITEKKAAAIPNAYVNANSNVQVLTEKKNKYKVKITEPVANGAVSSAGYIAKNEEAGSSAQNNNSTEKQSSAQKAISDESGFMAKENKTGLRRAAEENNTLAGAYGKMEPIDSVVFNDYRDKKMQLQNDSATEKKPLGKVVLSFTVNRKGQPENIKIEKSLCKACDEEAVTLLKNGPHWIYVPGKRKEAVVEF